MNNETITLELDGNENLALARAVLFRMQYLEQQSPSQDRDSEAANLANIIRKVAPQTTLRAQMERARLN